MQSVLPRRWRGLKTVETALLGGRGPIASPALNFAREYKRPRKPRCGDHRPLAPKRVKSVRGSRRRTPCVLENPPVFAMSGEGPASFSPIWICRRMVSISGNGATRQGMQSRRLFCAGKDGAKIMRNMR